jgi:GMP synthase-like glutamine amidotransferase
MHIHYLQHVPFEDPAHLITWARNRGHTVAGTMLYENQSLPPVDAFDFLVIMGGPMSVHDEARLDWLAAEKLIIRQAIDKGKFVLGICLGAQLIADVLQARVAPNAHREIGWYPVSLTPAARDIAFLVGLAGGFPAFHWHGDRFEIPAGAIHIMSSNACDNQGFVYRNRVLGLQFHLESTLPSIDRLIANCGNELQDGQFIQDAAAMRKEAAKLVPQINRTLEEMLDAWTGV